jgi:hypothetical protein
VRVWVDPEITFHLIDVSPLQESLLHEFLDAKRLGLSLFYPVIYASSNFMEVMNTEIGRVLSHCNFKKAAWKVLGAREGLDAMYSGYQHVGFSDEYTEKIDRGDYLSLLGLSQSEIVDAETASREAAYLISHWTSIEEVTRPRLRASALLAWTFARAYRADVVYTRSVETAKSLRVACAITNTNIRVFHSSGPITLDELAPTVLTKGSALDLVFFEAFARRFGELSHDFFSAVSPISQAVFSGEVTLQPEFGMRFEARVQPLSSSQLLPALLENQILSERMRRSEAEQIFGHLDEIKGIIQNNAASLQEIQTKVMEIIRKIPESRSLFEDIVNGASGSLLAANIIEAIRWALGGG